MNRPRVVARSFARRLHPHAADHLTIALALLLPRSDKAAHIFDRVTDGVIALLLFLHGVKLPRAAIMQGLVRWRLRLTVFASTFVLFPLLGPALRPTGQWLLTPQLCMGVPLVCALPWHGRTVLA